MYVSSTALTAPSNFSAAVVGYLIIIFNEYLLCCYSAVHLTTHTFSSFENLIISCFCCLLFTHGIHTVSVLNSLGHSTDNIISCLCCLSGQRSMLEHDKTALSLFSSQVWNIKQHYFDKNVLVYIWRAKFSWMAC